MEEIVAKHKKIMIRKKKSEREYNILQSQIRKISGRLKKKRNLNGIRKEKSNNGRKRIRVKQTVLKNYEYRI